ncbi:MAG TPA: SCO family protein [Terracidiphilus sp.]|nr:SCO family protein [Terracidiphilus sp.]
MIYRGTNRKSWRNVVISTAGAVVLGLLVAAPSLRAQSSPAPAMSSYGDKGLPSMTSAMSEKGGETADTKPGVLNSVGIDQHLNTQLPLNLTFTDDTGKLVPLSSYFGKVPAILMLIYYRCPMLCSEELKGLDSALEMVNFRPGKDFNIIAISIDPTETTEMAAASKREYVKMYGYPETANGWHFMTGTQENIDKITSAVGFRYVKLQVPDSSMTQYAHASALEIVTTQGKLAQYYMGVEYSPKDLLLGLDEASSNKIGSPVDNILTYCYHYDPKTNTHSLIVSRVIQLGGVLTMGMLGGFMFLMFRRDYTRSHAAISGSHGTEKKVNG